MAMAGGSDDGAPMMEMNMTPLIDVLLVLLIMFIITIPVATHATNIDLPSPAPSENQPDVDPIKNKIFLTRDDAILWNGEEISEGGLVANLQRTMQMTPEPELQFEPEPEASYALAADTLHLIKQVGVSKFGFVGNERYATFGTGSE